MNEYTTNQPIGGTQSNEPVFGTSATLCNGSCKDKSTISTCPLHHYFSTGANPPPYQGSKWMNGDVMFSSKTDEWETPQGLFDEYNTAYNFALDACADENNKKCKMFWSKEDDGLSKDAHWTIYGNVWMNPPYGRQIGKWVEKAFKESNEVKGNAVVCLLPARTDTKWFHDYCMAGNIRFLKGRLKFSNSKNTAPFPSMIVIFKSEV